MQGESEYIVSEFACKMEIRAAHQLFYERDEGLQVLFECEVELVSLLEVHRDCVMLASWLIEQ